MAGLKREARRLAGDLSHTFGRGVLFAMAATCLCLLVFLFVIANLLVPYRPITVHSYEAVPREVCPGESVEVNIEWEVRDDLRALEVDYSWSERGNPGAIFGGEARFEGLKETPRETVRSPLIRTAPTEPGMWRLSTSYDVYGSRLGLPVRQDIDDVTSEDFVRVLPADAPACEGGR